jgi:hypothetical protein
VQLTSGQFLNANPTNGVIFRAIMGHTFSPIVGHEFPPMVGQPFSPKLGHLLSPTGGHSDAGGIPLVMNIHKEYDPRS